MLFNNALIHSAFRHFLPCLGALIKMLVLVHCIASFLCITRRVTLVFFNILKNRLDAI